MVGEKGRFTLTRTVAVACSLLAASLASGQTLSLREALDLARENNGTLAAARKSRESAESSVRSALSAFWPTITPRYRHTNTRVDPGLFTGTTRTDELGIFANWTLLDGGQRWFSLERAKRMSQASAYQSLWTMRQVLFNVVVQYYDALRSSELLKVADAQVARAKQALEITQKQVEMEIAAAKDILQAKADLANAVVNQLTAKNAVKTSHAALKATIGWPLNDELPQLEEPQRMGGIEADLTIEQAWDRGIRNRPDLRDSQSRIEASKFDVLSAKRSASLDWSLNLSYDRTFESQDFGQRALTFLIHFPLFDGGFSKELVRQSELSFEASQKLFEQDLRVVRSEIESAFYSWKQDQERLSAAESALAAARENFKAAIESQDAGVASIVEVTNAQVSLVTAETNYVEAVYDFYISEIRLRLVMGEPMPGEEQ